jgi:VIT1/CCC1 family predicted Fe2+/Mn2+ transporter
LGTYNLAAVYRALSDAEATAADLREAGIEDRRIVVQDQRSTDEGPANGVVGPVRSQAPPTGEPVQTSTRRRDADIARTVSSRTVMVTGAATLAGAAMGVLIGLASFALGLGTWVALVVGAVAGSVFGAMAGGISGGMNQARTEEGFLVEVHADDSDQGRRIAEILGYRGPVRLDTMAADEGLRSA